MKLTDLPLFLQERVLAMDKVVQEAFLKSITQEWVDCQIAVYEMMKGIKEGKWTIDDIKNLMEKR